jgi:hypothetical protein
MLVCFAIESVLVNCVGMIQSPQSLNSVSNSRLAEENSFLLIDLLNSPTYHCKPLKKGSHFQHFVSASHLGTKKRDRSVKPEKQTACLQQKKGPRF